MRWLHSDRWLRREGATGAYLAVFANGKMARLNVVGACTLLLSVASCSKISMPQQVAQEPATPVPANPRPQSPSASFADPAVNTAPRQTAQPPVASAPGDPPPASAPAPAPAAAPALRPHPATVAKEAAMKIYPALGVKDSLFNKTFRDLYTEKAQQDPAFLTQADWPLLLARRTSELLAPLTAPSPAVAAPAPSQTIASAPPAFAPSSASGQAAPPASGHSFNPVAGPSALDRGAYHQTRSPYWRWNGYYWVYYPPTTSAPASTADSTGKSTPSTNPLDRGAYNQTRSPYWWPWTRYYYP